MTKRLYDEHRFGFIAVKLIGKSGLPAPGRRPVGSGSVVSLRRKSRRVGSVACRKLSNLGTKDVFSILIQADETRVSYRQLDYAKRPVTG